MKHSDDPAEPEERFERALAQIFDGRQIVPSGMVERVYSWDFAEDQVTFVLMVSMLDGRMVSIQAAPGEPSTCNDING